MVKITKRYNKSRRQKGGFWPFDTNEEQNGNINEKKPSMLNTVSDWFNTNTASTLPSNTLSNVPSNTNTPDTNSYPSNTNTPDTASNTSSNTNTPDTNSYMRGGYEPIAFNSDIAIAGGKRSRRMKGGYRGLGLTYYASNVDKYNVAEPTSYLKYTGGKRHKSKKCRKRKKCNKTCNKRHRHCRK